MLKELYDYAIKHKLDSKPGFKDKEIKEFISIGMNGKFISIDPVTKGVSYFCPDIATNGNYSNIIAEKAEIVFGVELTEEDGEKKRKTREQKIAFYKKGFSLGKTAEPLFEIVEEFMNNEEEFQKAKEAFQTEKYKMGDVISFKVDGEVLVEKTSYHDWWSQYRESLSESKTAKRQCRCFITGSLCTPETTVKKVSGLSSVGGHTSGDSLICFDKAAFRSFGFEQAANAAVSPEAVAAVNKGLAELIKKSHRIANAKFLHWYKEPVSEAEDPINLLFWGEEDLEEDINTEEEIEQKETELSAEKQASQLLCSMEKGEKPQQLYNRYYTMLLSGNNGRIMVRDYSEGSYEDVYNSFRSWYSDLSLVRCGKKGNLPHVKLFALYTRLLPRHKGEREIGKRIDQELSGLSRTMIHAVLENTPLPDAVAARALGYIRSAMLDSDQGKNGNLYPDATACRLLKAWLLRRKRNKNVKEECQLKAELNPNYEGKAYHLGRLMAVYAKLQEDALGNVGAGVIQRYYTSASTTPALVIGKLSTLSQYHLSKLAKPAQIWYNKLLQEISGSLECPLPSTLALTEQSEFALGYYHQMSELFKTSKKESEEN